jgi:hypothetical protein
MDEHEQQWENENREHEYDENERNRYCDNCGSDVFASDYDETFWQIHRGSLLPFLPFGSSFSTNSSLSLTATFYLLEDVLQQNLNLARVAYNASYGRTLELVVQAQKWVGRRKEMVRRQERLQECLYEAVRFS